MTSVFLQIYLAKLDIVQGNTLFLVNRKLYPS